MKVAHIVAEEINVAYPENGGYVTIKVGGAKEITVTDAHESEVILEK